jgi:hypothetical protein
MIRFTPYAEEKIRLRGLERDLVERTAADPEQILDDGERKIAQSRYTRAGMEKEYLVRVIYEEQGDDRLVVTAYQTSKITKYWRSP